MRLGTSALRPVRMEKNYYFVLEPGGSEDGPYMLIEIGRRLASGLVSPQASLCRAGETTWQPVDAPQFKDVFARIPPPMPLPPRAGTGTLPPIDAKSIDVEPLPALALRAPTESPVKAPRTPRTVPRPLLLGAAAVLGVGAAAIVGLLAFGSDDKRAEIKDAMVRVSTPTGTGAGFFIAGPDQYAYVATANHLVDRGDRVLIERDVELTNKKHFVEAYPETEIVASDPDADLAIIRIKNVEGRRFSRLPLAKEPVKDARIYSYGYPGSSLAKRAGLVSKDGKILSLVMFPAYDDRYARVLRENAVDGLLISNDVEPGMSGGPTCNDAGQVVGVNVTKDRAHVGQNGAVSVLALAQLVQKVKPASQQTELDPKDVVALLEKVEREYLLLPVDERAKVRETEFLAASDLPRLRRFVGEIRREERNSETAFNKLQLSGQAALGIFFARLPGKLLETYRAPSTKGPLARCELTNQRLAGFLSELETNDRSLHQRTQTKLDTCDDLAMRPLGWDLTAATMQWDGNERDYTVTKLDRMDDEGRTYRAQVRISGVSNLVEIWIGIEQGQPRLRLFDTTENLYAIASPRNVPASALQGTWVAKRPRVTDELDKAAEVESDENLSVSIDERRVSIRHVINQRYYIAGKRGTTFKCNHKNTIETGLLQSFVGTIENGVVVALPEKPAEPIGSDANACASSHRADRIVAVKLVGNHLFLYRTDGTAYPETLQFAKEDASNK